MATKKKPTLKKGELKLIAYSIGFIIVAAIGFILHFCREDIMDSIVAGLVKKEPEHCFQCPSEYYRRELYHNQLLQVPPGL